MNIEAQPNGNGQDRSYGPLGLGRINEYLLKLREEYRYEAQKTYRSLARLEDLANALKPAKGKNRKPEPVSVTMAKETLRIEAQIQSAGKRLTELLTLSMMPAAVPAGAVSDSGVKARAKPRSQDTNIEEAFDVGITEEPEHMDDIF